MKSIWKKKRLFRAAVALLGTAVLLLASACGHEAGQKQPASHDMMRLSNFTFSGEPSEVRAAHVPQRVLVCGNSGADTLIDLGAGGYIKMLTLTNALEEDRYRRLLPEAVILKNAPSRESALMLEPDGIVAWRRFFGEKQLGDTAFWNDRGIPAYIQDASGPIPALGKFPPCTVESEKRFIAHMGRLFEKEEQASHILGEIDEEIGKVPKEVSHPPRVLVVEFQGENIELFGKSLLSGDIVQRLGGVLIDWGQPFISKEELMATQADVVFVVYHGGKTEEERALSQMSQPAFQNIQAVQNGRVYPLPYEKIVAPGSRVIESIRLIRQGMYGK